MAVATAILGASGYSGQETLDRVLAHPELELVALGSDSLAGSPAGALDPRLNGSLPAFVTNDEALAAGAELVFCCLEHERAAALEPPAGAVVVDLGRQERGAVPGAGGLGQVVGHDHDGDGIGKLREQVLDPGGGDRIERRRRLCQEASAQQSADFDPPCFDPLRFGGPELTIQQ